MEQKPIIVRIEDAKIELMQDVNEILQKHELNCYLLEPIIANLYNQVKMQAQDELVQAKAQMDNNTK